MMFGAWQLVVIYAGGGSLEQLISSDGARAHLGFPGAQHHRARFGGNVALGFPQVGGTARPSCSTAALGRCESRGWG